MNLLSVHLVRCMVVHFFLLLHHTRLLESQKWVLITLCCLLMRCDVLTLCCVLLCQGGPRISEAERRKQRELVAKEIEKLQSGIQALCRSTTPLGKIVDYVQVSVWVCKRTCTLGRTGCVSSRLTFCLYR